MKSMCLVSTLITLMLLMESASIADALALSSSSSRRRFLNGAVIGGTTLSFFPSVSSAAAPSLERLRLGHARIRYLLDNWDSVTSVCGTTIMSDTERKQVVRTENGNTCTKTPLRVQEYMGYKNVNDPLYRIDKFLLQVIDAVPDANVDAYLNALEQYREMADQTAVLAYTSSWGEANPNGSKEAVDDYLEQTKAQVIESERLLRNVLGYLQLEPLPPLKNGKL